MANNIPLIVNTGPAAGLFLLQPGLSLLLLYILQRGINSININVISNDSIYTPFKRALLS